ncbi:hypothetical protein DASC09_025510 [Saccharomycopsis crataegensis]|uniref:Uncharacterized protein n=1 Tax=Saccharomycopsis crataegensis TaxID=43959 RepID=A0AAV5QKP8_9ASCO|nr:hypothetical protein DASC09_025510 [Saccharomycopsis crataegensis]
MQFFNPLVLSAFAAIASAETVHSFVATVTNVESFVPVGAVINSADQLVYTTVEGATSTSVYTNGQGYITTSIDGGSIVTTTAATNMASATVTETTTFENTQIVSFGDYYTTTTYDIDGNAHTAYVKEDPFIQFTETSWDYNGKAHTLYYSASTHDGTTSFEIIDGSVSGMYASSPTTDTSLTSYTSGVYPYSTGLATSQNHNAAGSLAVGGLAGMAGLAGAAAAMFL